MSRESFYKNENVLDFQEAYSSGNLDSIKIPYWFDVDKNNYRVITGAGDVIHGSLTNIEQFGKEGFDVFLCFKDEDIRGDSSYDIPSNVQYLEENYGKDSENPKLLCLINMDYQDQVNRFIELFYEKCEYITNHSNGPSFKPRQARNLLKDNGSIKVGIQNYYARPKLDYIPKEWENTDSLGLVITNIDRSRSGQIVSITVTKMTEYISMSAMRSRGGSVSMRSASAMGGGGGGGGGVSVSRRSASPRSAMGGGGGGSRSAMGENFSTESIRSAIAEVSRTEGSAVAAVLSSASRKWLKSQIGALAGVYEENTKLDEDWEGIYDIPDIDVPPESRSRTKSPK